MCIGGQSFQNGKTNWLDKKTIFQIQNPTIIL